MKFAVVTALLFLCVCISNYIGHTDPPFSISFTPILIGVSALVTVLFTAVRPLVKILVVATVFILNDILIKLYAGGTLDIEGLGWISFYEGIAIVIAFAILVIAFFVNYKRQTREKATALLSFAFILALYTSYFYKFGMITINYPTHNIAEAISKKLYVSELFYSDDLLLNDKDTFRLKTGWVEKQTRLNHNAVLRTTEYTGNYSYIIPVTGQFQKYTFENHIYWAAMDSSYINAKPIDAQLVFSEPQSSQRPVKLYFFTEEQHELKFLKQINIGIKSP